MMESMRKMTRALLASVALILALMSPGKTEAAGLLIADGGFGGVLEIKEHVVQVTINNGIAVTDVTQIFQNTENRQVEALYTFPVPNGASVANFSMWINDREMIGEVVEMERAREIYNSYKAKRQDPGLLEQVDYKTFEMRIFPINPGAEQKVRITYYQEINVDHEQGTYLYPLATVTRSDIDSKTSGKFAINVEIKSAVPIVGISSPSHGEAFVVATHSDSFCLASLEAAGGSLASDVVINYDLSRPRSGIDLITSKQKGEDGYFCLTVTAGKELAAQDAGMDFVFVLDISGSMANDGKMIVSRKALDAFIDGLGEKDRFEVITFNVAPDVLFGELKGSNDSEKNQARAWMAAKSAKGGTTLAPAMTTAYKYADPDRPLNVVIMSDGMTEQAERRVLLQMIGSRPRNARVFCIGIGNEVNRPMLEQMAEDSGGLAAFISNGDNFERAARGFRRKLMRPVASDLRLDFEGIRVHDVEPAVLPNLYHGAPVRVYGRYAGDGDARITLSGTIQGKELKQSMTIAFPADDPGNPEIERMWALKRVDTLLKTADRTGSRAPVLDEIIRLGETYSIVTEYTSFLVLENDAEFRRWKIDRRNTDRLDRDRKAQARRQEELERIKAKAVSTIGPRDPASAPEMSVNIAKQAPGNPPQNGNPGQAPVVTAPRNGQSRDLAFGSGPVGPLFVGLVLWLRRRKTAGK